MQKYEKKSISLKAFWIRALIQNGSSCGYVVHNSLTSHATEIMGYANQEPWVLLRIS